MLDFQVIWILAIFQQENIQLKFVKYLDMDWLFVKIIEI